MAASSSLSSASRSRRPSFRSLRLPRDPLRSDERVDRAVAPVSEDASRIGASAMEGPQISSFCAAPPRVLILCGGWADGHCGVADYAARLAEELTYWVGLSVATRTLPASEARSRRGGSPMPERTPSAMAFDVPAPFSTDLEGILAWWDAYAETLEEMNPPPAKDPAVPAIFPLQASGRRAIREILRIVDESGSEIVHLQYPSRGFGSALFPVLLPAWLRLFRPDLRVVVTLHEFRRAHPLRKLADLVAVLPAHVAVLPTGRDLARIDTLRRPMGATLVIPCGARPQERPPPRGPIAGRIFHYGHPVASKGIDLLIRAIGGLRGTHPEISLELVCSDPERRCILQRLAAECGVEDRLFCHDWLPDEKLRTLAARAEVLVFPFRDGFSLERSSLLNLLDVGTPILTTRGSPVLPLLACEPESQERLEVTLDQLLRGLHGDGGAEIRRRLGELQQALASFFSYRRIAEAHAALYASLTQKRRAAPRDADGSGVGGGPV